MVELDSMPKDVGKGFIDDDPDAADGMLRLIMFTADGRTFEDAEVSGLAFIGGRFVGDLLKRESRPARPHSSRDWSARRAAARVPATATRTAAGSGW